MISRGQVYFVDLSPTRGREQAGRRPVLVVSSDAINRQPLVVTVVVGTDAAKVPHDYPTNVRVTAQESGLPKDTVFLCFQLRSLDPARFIDPKAGRPVPAGALPSARMAEVDEALRWVLGL
jgi:mRNA interferase MazF